MTPPIQNPTSKIQSGLPRWLGMAVSLVAVTAAYWAYALVAVPLIEPAAPGPPPGGEENVAASDLRVREMEGLFPPGSWQLAEPKILEDGQNKLLFQEYQNLPDGSVEIKPCTVVHFPTAPGLDEAHAAAAALILEAPAGRSSVSTSRCNWGGPRSAACRAAGSTAPSPSIAGENIPARTTCSSSPATCSSKSGTCGPPSKSSSARG